MSNSVSVLINQGKSAPGSFNAAVNYETQFAPLALTLSDLNENGLLDIVATNEASSTVSVFVNNGDGTFQSAVNQSVNNTPMSITSGRFTKGVRTYFTLGIASTTACTQSKNGQLSLSLTSSVNPSFYGQLVTFTAKASGSTGGTTPVGTIVFTIDGVAQNPVALVNGQAFTVATSLSVGAHTVEAFYSGDLYYPPTTSSLTQTVIVTPVVCPPRGVDGVQKRAMTPCGWDRYNVITWKAPSKQAGCCMPLMYYIYRDASLTDFVTCVPGKEHKYIDRNLVKGVKYTYYIVAVDALGIQSKPVKVTVRPHH